MGAKVCGRELLLEVADSAQKRNEQIVHKSLFAFARRLREIGGGMKTEAVNNVDQSEPI
jgi:hypothetical protein